MISLKFKVINRELWYFFSYYQLRNFNKLFNDFYYCFIYDICQKFQLKSYSGYLLKVSINYQLELMLIIK
jgi:hypothetical protein